MPISPHAAEYAEPSRMRVGYVITTPEVRSPLMPGVRGDFGENLAVLKDLGYDTLEVAMRDPGRPRRAGGGGGNRPLGPFGDDDRLGPQRASGRGDDVPSR